MDLIRSFTDEHPKFDLLEVIFGNAVMEYLPEEHAHAREWARANSMQIKSFKATCRMVQGKISEKEARKTSRPLSSRATSLAQGSARGNPSRKYNSNPGNQPSHLQKQSSTAHLAAGPAPLHFPQPDHRQQQQPQHKSQKPTGEKKWCIMCSKDTHNLEECRRAAAYHQQLARMNPSAANRPTAKQSISSRPQHQSQGDHSDDSESVASYWTVPGEESGDFPTAKTARAICLNRSYSPRGANMAPVSSLSYRPPPTPADTDDHVIPADSFQIQTAKSAIAEPWTLPEASDEDEISVECEDVTDIPESQERAFKTVHHGRKAKLSKISENATSAAISACNTSGSVRKRRAATKALEKAAKAATSEAAAIAKGYEAAAAAKALRSAIQNLAAIDDVDTETTVASVPTPRTYADVVGNAKPARKIERKKVKPSTSSRAKSHRSPLPSTDEQIAKMITCEVDSGANAHYFTSSEGLMNVNTEQRIAIRTADGNVSHSSGTGEIPGVIGLVHIVEGFSDNLLSVSKLVDDGHEVVFPKDNTVLITKDGEMVARGGKNDHGLYTVDVPLPFVDDCPHAFGEHMDITFGHKCHIVGTHIMSPLVQHHIWILHKRYLHASAHRLKRIIVETMGHGIPKSVPESAIQLVIGNCLACGLSKSTARPHHNLGGKISASEPFELIHYDLKGPMPTSTYSRKAYALVIVDDFTRAKYVALLKNKGEAFAAIKSFVSGVVRPLKYQVRSVRSDNAAEFKSEEMKKWAEENCIKLTYSPAYASQSNGIAERAIRTIDTAAEVLRTAANLPPAAWGECYVTAALLERYIPRVGDGRSPHEIITGKPPPHRKLRAFGCTAFVNVPVKLRKALGPRAQTGILVGYSENSPAYRIMTNTTSGSIVESSDVIFNEGHFGTAIASDGLMSSDDDFIHQTAVPNVQISAEDSTLNHLAEPYHPDAGNTSLDTVPSSQEGGAIARVKPTRSTRQTRSTRSNTNIQIPVDWTRVSRDNIDKIDDQDLIIVDENATDGDIDRLINPMEQPCQPDLSVKSAALTNLRAMAAQRISFKEAIRDEGFLLSMQKELDTITKLGGWDLVDLPAGRKAIGCVWVHKRKFVNGTFERNKSRICPQGFSQVEGVDYFKDQTAAPTIALASVRLYFSIVSCRGMSELQLDVDGAFTIPKLKETVYMRIPPGLPQHQGKALRLNHSLNGLKQGAWNWYVLLNDFLIDHGYVPCVSEPCLYRKWNQNRDLVLITLYTDDLRIAADNPDDLTKFEKELTGRFPNKRADIGQFLGVQVTRQGDTIKLSQKIAIEDLIKEHGLEELKPAKLPAKANDVLMPVEGQPDVAFMKTFPYRSIVGSLLWISRASRDDISFAVGQVGRFGHCFDQSHVNAVLNIVAYLKGTMDMTLDFHPQDQLVLEAYSDADFAGIPSNGDKPMRSTTGIVVKVKGCSTILSQAVIQPTVTRSTSESEYVALSCTIQKLLCVKTLLTELQLNCSEPDIAYEDNQVTITKMESPVVDFKLRHLWIHYHWIKQSVHRKECLIKYIPSAENVADLFTKALPFPQFSYLRKLLLNHD